MGFSVLPPQYAEYSLATRLPLTPFEVRDALEMALPQAGFRTAEFARAMQYASATVESEPRGGRLNLKVRCAIEVAWAEDPRQSGFTYVEWMVYDDRSRPRQYDEDMTRQFGGALAHATAHVLGMRGHLPEILGPGERIDEREASRIATAPDRVRDYAGCARPDEAAVLHAGAWPVGRYLHFGKDVAEPSAGAPLYVDDVRVATIVGQAGSDTTRLLWQWAVDAQRRGCHVLFIGGGTSSMPATGWLEVGVAEMDVLPRGRLTPATSAQIRHLCTTLAGGEDATARQEGEWLAAFVHLLLLRAGQADASGDRGTAPRLSTLVPWLLDEDTAIAAIQAARGAEAASRDDASVAHPAHSARFWTAKLHGLISPRWELGKRDPSVPYEAATARLLHAIEPFLPLDGDSRCAWADLLGDEPIAVALRLPADAPASATILPTVQLRLEQVLSTASRRPLLVAIDAAAGRAATLDLARLVASARGGPASTCVVSGDDAAVIDLHDRADAQVWLMPLAEPAAAAVNKQLGPRARQIVTVEVAARQNRTARVSWQDNASYFHDTDLRQPPGGRAPAVVLARRAGSLMKPVITDLDVDALTLVVDAHGGGHYRTIGEAVDVAPPYARLVVRPGVYAEEIEIRRALSIEGAGVPGEVVIAPPEWYCVTTRAPELRLSNLTLRTESAYALRVQAGRVTAIGCHMTSNVELGSGCDGRFHHCRIERGRLDAGAGSRLLAEYCSVSATEVAEAVLVMDSHAVVRRSLFEGATKCALLTDGGDALFEDCVLRGVRYGVITFSGRTVLRRCVIEQVSEAAILNHHGSHVQLDASRVDGPVLRGMES